MKRLLSVFFFTLVAIYCKAQCTPPTTPVITTPSTVRCSNAQTILTANIQGLSYFYEWYKDNVLVHSGQNSYYFHFFASESEVYKVRYYNISNPGCFSPFSSDLVISVKPTPTINVSPIGQRICSGGTANITLSSNVPGTVFTWIVNHGSVSGASDGSGNTIAQTLTNTFTSSPWENVLYYVRGSADGCTSSQVQAGVSVHPIPTFQAISPTTICEGGNVDFSVAPSGGYFERNGNPFPIGSPMVSGTYTYNISVPATPACVTTSAPITITVLPTPSVTISSATPTTFCTGQSVTLVANLLPSNGNYRYDWRKGSQFVGQNQGYTANSSGTYTVKVDNLDCNYRGNYSSTAIIPVIENSVNPGYISNYPGNLSNPSQIVCQGGDPSAFAEIFGGYGAGTTGYQWQVTYDGINYNIIPGATGATHDIPPGMITQTSSYIRVTSSTLNNVTCYANSNFAGIIVNPTPSFTPGIILPVCSGSINQVLLPYTNLSGSGFEYRIDWTTLNDIPWTTLPANQIPISIPSTPGTYTGGIYLRNPTICESMRYPLTVVVKPKPVITTPNKTICSGQSTDLTLLSNITETTFSWIVQSKSPSISGVSQGATGTTSMISHILTNSSTSTAGTVVYRVTPTANGCSGTFKDITVTVNPNITGGVIAANQTICPIGDPAAFTQTTASTGPGTLSYEWHTSLDNITYGNPVSGAIGTTYNIPGGVVTQTTYYKRLTSATQNGITCSAYSNPVTITVTPLSGGLIAADQLICSGGNPAPFTQTQAATGSGTLSYQWQKSTGGGPFTNILPAVTTATYDVLPGLAQTTSYRRVTTSSQGGCTANSNVLTVTVLTVPAVIIPASSTTFCGLQPVSVLLNANTGANLAYQWLKNGANIPGAIASSYTATQAGSYTVRVTNTVTSCFVVSAPVNVTQGSPFGSIIQSGELCAGGYATLTAGPGSGYQWYQEGSPLYYSYSSQLIVYVAGTYSVAYTSNSGCEVSASHYVDSNPPPGSPCHAARKNPDQNGSEEDIEEPGFFGVFPNPANQEVNIELPAAVNKPTPVALYDAFGRVVYQSVFKAGERNKTVSTINFADGIYMMQLLAPQGSKVTRKVMVKH